MDIDKLKYDLEKHLGKNDILNISCCEDDTKSYKAYNELDNMYLKDDTEEYNINIFNYDIEELANKLEVDYDTLNNLYLNNHVPSKGLSLAIMIIMNLDIDTVIEKLTKLKYNLGDSESDRIIRYFITNNIRDINLLNDMLISFGQMYLFSRKKLR